jgi:hypothetical protein
VNRALIVFQRSGEDIWQVQEMVQVRQISHHHGRAIDADGL